MKSIAQEKSYNFALKIIKFYKLLVEEKREYIISKQLLRSGISIGANIEEALGAQSRRDFGAKLSIAYKEARETHYWLRLLKDSLIATDRDCFPILLDCDEILRIIGSIKKTIFSNS